VQGWAYTGATIAAAISLADAFARLGNTELYNYTSSAGIQGTDGGPKSLQAAITTHYQMLDHQIIRYRSPDTSTDPNEIIDSDCDQNTTTCNFTGDQHSIGDVYATPANNWYKSAYFKSIYMRTAPLVGGGTVPQYPTRFCCKNNR
jgi:hypothetical protein